METRNPECQRLRHCNGAVRSPRLRNAGDVKAVDNGLLEIRVHHGPGYRLYRLRDGDAVVALCGGDKGSQQRDIKCVGRLAKDWRQT